MMSTFIRLSAMSMTSLIVNVFILFMRTTTTTFALSDLAATASRSPRYNFGPASQRDKVLFSAERPGNPPGKKDPIPDEKVVEWIQFMQEKEQNIHTVVALLDENELVNYEPTGLLTLYQKYGLQCRVQSINDPRAAYNLFQLFKQAEAAQQRVVTHCTGGIGRCGRVAGAWLMYRYQLTPEQASQETLQCAQDVGMIRACEPDKLKEWMDTQQLNQ